MKTIDIQKLLRPNIRSLVPYSSARSEYSGKGTVYLDANENSIGSVLGGGYNRYPDPMQQEVKKAISTIKQIATENIFLGNGSDEPIDLLIRSFCVPGKDNIITFPPTYGMYEVAAKINDVAVKEVLLNKNFQIDMEAAYTAIDEQSKLLFICTPNNPTGNIIDEATIIDLLENFNGLVIVDEAYIDFAGNSLLSRISKYQNLVVLQTLSKAWGLAGLRLGMAFANPEIIAVFNKVKAPYNINLSTQQLALDALKNGNIVVENIATIISERERLATYLQTLPFIRDVYPSQANFLLVKTDDANRLYNFLRAAGIIVRNRSSMPLCDNSIRITVGTAAENDILIDTLKLYNNG